MIAARTFSPRRQNRLRCLTVQHHPFSKSHVGIALRSSKQCLPPVLETMCGFAETRSTLAAALTLVGGLGRGSHGVEGVFCWTERKGPWMLQEQISANDARRRQRQNPQAASQRTRAAESRECENGINTQNSLPHSALPPLYGITVIGV